jgi:PAS domain S-box-containing protein
MNPFPTPDQLRFKRSLASDIFNQLVASVEEYAIFALDITGNILTWNLGAEKLKGYAEGDVVGTHFSRFYTPEDIARNHPANELRIALNSGKYEEEGWRVRKDGSRFWAYVVITAIRNSEGVVVGFGKVTRDLTEKKRTEDELRLAYASLEFKIQARTKELSEAKLEAEKAVQARDQFFSIASHELKTPLTSLKLYIQARRRRVKKGDYSNFTEDKLDKLCDDDNRQVARLTYLVDKMFDTSKLASGNFSLSIGPVEIVELVEDCVQQMAHYLEEAGNVCTIDTNISKVVGQWDRHRLEQVMVNLLSNACKYAPGKPIAIHISRDSKHVKVSVRDFGRGIPADKVARVFIPFHRLDERLSLDGLGLGLYVCKQIVAAHGGDITVESEPKKGSRFTIELPLHV